MSISNTLDNLFGSPHKMVLVVYRTEKGKGATVTTAKKTLRQKFEPRSRASPHRATTNFLTAFCGLLLATTKILKKSTIFKSYPKHPCLWIFSLCSKHNLPVSLSIFKVSIVIASCPSLCEVHCRYNPEI